MALKIGDPGHKHLQSEPVFTIVKVSDTLASFIDSLGYILNDFGDKRISVEGQAVIHISGQWRAMTIEAFIIDTIYQGILAFLTSKSMIVSTSPHIEVGDNTWPASLAQVSDMITVGGVSPLPLPGIPYGARYPWSIGGPVRVNTHGGGDCITEGGNAAVTTGLICSIISRYPGLCTRILSGPAELDIGGETVCLGNVVPTT